MANVRDKVLEVVSTFPEKAADIERGRNPGDVLDPYILAATQTLLYAGHFRNAIRATVAHKSLMIIEGLMGHLHEDVIGEMRRAATLRFISQYVPSVPIRDVR